MSIDWSKAPVDATHHFASQNGYAELWAKPGFFMRADSKTREWLKDNSPMGLELATARQKPWDGEGLPPLGTVCEYLGAHQYDQWSRVTIFAEWKDLVFVDFSDGWRQERDASRFRPIRTPEQISSSIKERDKACDAMYGVILGMPEDRRHNRSDIVEALYDAGYRKQ